MRRRTRRSSASLRGLRSRVGRRTSARSGRDSMGRFRKGRKNPFDRHGMWHKASDGEFGHPSFGGGRMKAKRSRFTSRVARGRKRTARGTFRNPGGFLENPFRDKAGRLHRNDGKFAKRRKVGKRRKSVASRRRRAVRCVAPRRTKRTVRRTTAKRRTRRVGKTRAAISFRSEMARLGREHRENPRGKRKGRKARKTSHKRRRNPAICNPPRRVKRRVTKRRGHRRARR